MTVRNALVGRYAEASVGGVLIALLFDWECTFEGKTIETTAHGDVWERCVPGTSSWTFRAKGYVVPGSANHYLRALWSGTAVSAGVVVAGFSGSVASGTMIFQGTGIPTRGNLTAPMEMAEQEFEVRGDGPPTVGVS